MRQTSFEAAISELLCAATDRREEIFCKRASSDWAGLIKSSSQLPQLLENTPSRLVPALLTDLERQGKWKLAQTQDTLAKLFNIHRGAYNSAIIKHISVEHRALLKTILVEYKRSNGVHQILWNQLLAALAKAEISALDFADNPDELFKLLIGPDQYSRHNPWVTYSLTTADSWQKLQNFAWSLEDLLRLHNTLGEPGYGDKKDFQKTLLRILPPVLQERFFDAAFGPKSSPWSVKSALQTARDAGLLIIALKQHPERVTNIVAHFVYQNYFVQDARDFLALIIQIEDLQALILPALAQLKPSFVQELGYNFLVSQLASVGWPQFLTSAADLDFALLLTERDPEQTQILLGALFNSERCWPVFQSARQPGFRFRHLARDDYRHFFIAADRWDPQAEQRFSQRQTQLAEAFPQKRAQILAAFQGQPTITTVLHRLGLALSLALLEQLSANNQTELLGLIIAIEKFPAEIAAEFSSPAELQQFTALYADRRGSGFFRTNFPAQLTRLMPAEQFWTILGHAFRDPESRTALVIQTMQAELQSTAAAPSAPARSEPGHGDGPAAAASASSAHAGGEPDHEELESDDDAAPGAAGDSSDDSSDSEEPEGQPGARAAHSP